MRLRSPVTSAVRRLKCGCAFIFVTAPRLAAFAAVCLVGTRPRNELRWRRRWGSCLALSRQSVVSTHILAAVVAIIASAKWVTFHRFVPFFKSRFWWHGEKTPNQSFQRTPRKKRAKPLNSDVRRLALALASIAYLTQYRPCASVGKLALLLYPCTVSPDVHCQHLRNFSAPQSLGNFRLAVVVCPFQCLL